MSFSEKEIHIWLIKWYSVGIVGFMIEPIRFVFRFLTPFGIIMAVVLLLYFHEPKNRKDWFVFSGIAISAFFIELIGVNTQLFFGHYSYGETLGFKIWGAPLTIGLNWLVLIVCIASLMGRIRDRWYYPLVGASALVAFDWLIEPVAIATDMWSWAGGDVPSKNYIDWFLLSGFFFLMIRILKIELRNPIAGILIGMQGIFFLALNLLIKTPLWVN